jgi:hypothetical protein
VKAAATNWKSGGEVVTLLLEKHGADVIVTEEVARTATIVGKKAS